MSQRISIRRFMAIREAEVAVPRLLLLIGEQASGKSTIGKLIYFFKSLRRDLLYLLYDSFAEEGNDWESLYAERVAEKFYSFFGDSRWLGDFEVRYFYAPEKYLTLSARPDGPPRLEFGAGLRRAVFEEGRAAALLRDMRRFAPRRNTYETVEFQKAVAGLEHWVDEIFEDDREPLFIPAGRNITVNYPERFKLDFYGSLRGDLARMEDDASRPPAVDLHLMVQFLEQVEVIKSRFEEGDFRSLVESGAAGRDQAARRLLDLAVEKAREVLKGEYRRSRTDEMIFYDEQGFVYLNRASSGQQEVIRILQDFFLILLDQERVFRVIEEPEAHLYPLAQKQLMELAALVSNATDSQMVVTTHSPYILSVFNNLLFAMRVAGRGEEVRTRVEAVLPSACWLTPSEFGAYFLTDGGCRSVFDREAGLIDQNALDEISEELGMDFDALYEIYGETFG